MSNSETGTNISYLEHEGKYKGILSWLLTTDHKRIALLYLYCVIVFFFVAAILGLLMRIELIAPGQTIMGPQTYNGMFTIHGIIMIFVIVIPALPAIFGNFFLPIMIGAKDVAFPKLNLFSFYLYIIGAISWRSVTIYWRWVARYRMDLLCPLQCRIFHKCHICSGGGIHPWFFINSYRIEFYRHNAQDESPRDGLVQNASFSVVVICYGMDPGAGNSYSRYNFTDGYR